MIFWTLFGSTAALSNRLKFVCGDYSGSFQADTGNFGQVGGAGPVGPIELKKPRYRVVFIV